MWFVDVSKLKSYCMKSFCNLLGGYVFVALVCLSKQHYSKSYARTAKKFYVGVRKSGKNCFLSKKQGFGVGWRLTLPLTCHTI